MSVPPVMPEQNPRSKKRAFRAQVPRGQFERPIGRKLSIEVLDQVKDALYPRVHISSIAHGKMRALIAAASPNEVTWLPAIEILSDGSVHVYDIFVPGQECGPGTTNVTTNGESDLYSELVASGQTQTITKLLGWGHSHVWFDVYASGIDETTTRQYLTSFHSRKKTHFVRLIGNCFDDMFVSIYLIQQGVVIHHPLIHAEPTNTNDYVSWATQQVREKVSVIRPQPIIKQGLFSTTNTVTPADHSPFTEGYTDDTYRLHPDTKGGNYGW